MFSDGALEWPAKLKIVLSNIWTQWYNGIPWTIHYYNNLIINYVKNPIWFAHSWYFVYCKINLKQSIVLIFIIPVK